MRKMIEDYIGTCGACMGEFKVGDDKRMVLHGYRQPGHGYTEGECMGSDHPPFEYDTSLTISVIAMHREAAAAQLDRVSKLQAGKVAKLERKWTEYEYATRKNVAHSELVGPESEFWPHLLKVEIANAESLAQFITQMADYKQARVDAWTPGQVIVSIDVPATGKVRGIREAYDPEVEAEKDRKATEKAEREAKPGKLKLTLFWDASSRTDIPADEMVEIKAWVKRTFPTGKQRITQGSDFMHVPWVVRQADRASGLGDPLGKDRHVVLINIDWSYLDEIASLLPGSTRVDETRKKVEFWLDVSAEKPWNTAERNEK